MRVGWWKPKKFGVIGFSDRSDLWWLITSPFALMIFRENCSAMKMVLSWRKNPEPETLLGPSFDRVILSGPPSEERKSRLWLGLFQ
jgi:hypothetical protein